ncbi:hypothetical protein D770_12070 [Flammeovirgaceae bacterium 311]|nr:hypothetical protein D770_12070 [Flammeovirgaceae bacterium 311]
MQTKTTSPVQLVPAPRQGSDASVKTFHPLSALLLHSLPQLGLLGLWSLMLLSFQSSLQESARPYFYTTFCIILTVWLCNLGYAVYCYRRRQGLSVRWAVASLVAYVVLIVLYYQNLDLYQTLGVPSWQQPGDILHYTGSFIIPAVLHLLTLLAVWFSNRSTENRGWRTALMGLLPPLLCYLMVMGAFGLRLPVSFDSYWFILLVACATVASVFYLILGVVRLNLSRFGSRELGSVVKFLLTGLLPLGCLMFNNGSFWGDPSNSEGMFGDFNHPLFYVLAVVNGLLISLPDHTPAKRPWIFIGRCMLLPFSLYFFFVMAPYMPFSIFLVIFLGLGLLLLTPIVVIVFHLKALIGDIRMLSNTSPLLNLALAGAIAFMVLPAGIFITYQHDRVVLHQALDYLDDPGATAVEVSTFSLHRTLSHIQGNKVRGDRWFDQRHTPLLSPWFTWQVLDGLSLSDTKVSQIQQVFLNKPLSRQEQPFSRWSRPESGSVTLDSLTGSSYYNAEAGHWVSEVQLEMHNPTNGWQEYLTQFELPAGSWVSDYYLYLGDQKEPGLLVEKKAALWVYDQITRTRKDPGLLRYLPGGALELRVYPFTEEQTRRTGFTLLHKRPFTLALDGKQLQLGDPDQLTAAPQLAQTSTGVFIPAEHKVGLPTVEREGYWHFIIDCSENNEALLQNYKAAIEQLLQEYPLLAAKAKISFTGHSVATFPLQASELEQLWQQQTFEGGFYLERALQSLLLDHYRSSEQDFPVPVVITNNYENAILTASLPDLSFAMSGQQHFYRLKSNATLAAYAYGTPKEELDAAIEPPQQLSSLAWPDAAQPRIFLKPDGKDALLPLPVQVLSTEATAGSEWDEGLKLWTDWQGAQLYPAADSWKAQVKSSFAAHILSPHTAFMVVEEAWQKDMLLRKQEQYLNGHPGIDSGTELVEMPEPEFWVLLILLFLWLGWRKRAKWQQLRQQLQKAIA